MNDKFQIIYTDGATVGYNGKLGTVTQVGLGIYIKGYGKFNKLTDGGSNNEAEFMALIWAMELAAKLEFKYIKFFMDSKIVQRRANGHRPKGKWENKRMDKFQDKVLLLKTKFEECYFYWIPREKNYVADELSKKAINSVTIKKLGYSI